MPMAIARFPSPFSFKGTFRADASSAPRTRTPPRVISFRRRGRRRQPRWGDPGGHPGAASTGAVGVGCAEPGDAPRLGGPAAAIPAHALLSGQLRRTLRLPGGRRCQRRRLQQRCRLCPGQGGPGGDIRLVIETAEGKLVPAPAAEYAELDRFIAGQACLRRQRGYVLQRNSCQHPWTSQTDARFSHVVPGPGGRSLELGLDIFNVLHLIDTNWGLIRRMDDTPSSNSPATTPPQGEGSTASPRGRRWQPTSPTPAGGCN